MLKTLNLIFWMMEILSWCVCVCVLDYESDKKIEQEIIELRKDNKNLAKQVEDQIKQFRNTGAL